MLPCGVGIAGTGMPLHIPCARGAVGTMPPPGRLSKKGPGQGMGQGGRNSNVRHLLNYSKRSPPGREDRPQRQGQLRTPRPTHGALAKSQCESTRVRAASELRAGFEIGRRRGRSLVILKLALPASASPPAPKSE